jgi:hypothetical protein
VGRSGSAFRRQVSINMDLFNYFINDPLRILTVIGGTGGLLYWYDRYKTRSRIKIRLLANGLVPSSSDNKNYISFEAENFGSAPVSLEPDVLLKGIIPIALRIKSNKRLKWSNYNFKIETSERALPPHQPKTFKAVCDCKNSETAFLWFITYTFSPTRGRARRIRLRSASGKKLSYARYLCEIALYIVFNKLNIEEKEK